MQKSLIFILLIILLSCAQQQVNEPTAAINNAVVAVSDTTNSNTIAPQLLPPENNKIQTGQTTPEELLSFAKSLTGIPYKYGSIDPSLGFDCSGFITYVFNHFNIAVPRSSVDFTNVEKQVSLAEAKPGDLILFTGTDSNIRVVGHMGIITSNINNTCEFIHSTSGKANGVTITPLNKYYMGRFVKIIRIFRQNDSD